MFLYKKRTCKERKNVRASAQEKKRGKNEN